MMNSFDVIPAPLYKRNGYRQNSRSNVYYADVIKTSAIFSTKHYKYNKSNINLVVKGELSEKNDLGDCARPVG